MTPIVIEYFGIIACVFTFTMYISTIDQIRAILKTKKSDEVSLLFYIMLFFNCFFWIIYGSLISNYYILTPNLIGFALSILTIIVVHKYR